MSDPAEWSKLDRRTITATAIILLGAAVLAGVPTTVGLASWRSFGFAMMWVLPGAAILILGGTLADYLRWRKTFYRVLPDAIELRKGILFTSRRRLARDRIRAVDLNAHLVYRAFGLVKLNLGTGEQGGGSSAQHTLVLDPISRSVGEELRSQLLERESPAESEAGKQRLATWNPAWIGYAPLSIATLIFVGGIVGVTFQVSEWFGRGAFPVEITRDLIRDYGLWPVLILGLIGIHVAAIVASIGFYIELWWRYRLDREPGGTLLVTRGFLTTRSLSLEEERIRGVDYIEPLGVRLVGAARVQAVATGLSQEAETNSEISTLLPAAPRELAISVAEKVSGQRPDIALTTHPAAAWSRRLRWALMVILVLVAAWVIVIVTANPGSVLIVFVSMLLTLVAIGLVARARDSARNLGHALTPAHLVSRRGSIRRSTVLLRRGGIIGWRFRQSIFQRRVGLSTLVAITAAGRGHYPVLDGDEHILVDLADAAVPDLLDQFLICDT